MSRRDEENAVQPTAVSATAVKQEVDEAPTSDAADANEPAEATADSVAPHPAPPLPPQGSSDKPIAACDSAADASADAAAQPATEAAGVASGTSATVASTSASAVGGAPPALPTGAEPQAAAQAAPQQSTARAALPAAATRDGTARGAAELPARSSRGLTPPADNWKLGRGVGRGGGCVPRPGAYFKVADIEIFTAPLAASIQHARPSHRHAA